MEIHVVVIQNVGIYDSHAIAVTLKNLRNYLSRIEEISFSIICGRSKNSEDANMKDTDSIFEIDTSLYSVLDNIKFIFLSFKKLRFIHKKKEINIIHARYPFSSLVAAILFKRFVSPETKIVYDIRSPWIEIQGEKSKIFSNSIIKRTLYFIERLLFKNVDGFFFTNKLIAKHYMRYDPGIKFKPKTYLITEYNPKTYEVNKDLRKELNLHEKDLVLITITALHPRREINFLIKGFHEFVRKFNVFNLKFLIIGDGPDKKNLEKLVKVKGLSNKIKFIGHVKHDLVSEYLSVADIGISHSPNKFTCEVASPLKIPEYISCGVPVLASDVPGHRILHEYIESIYLYKNNSESFCKKLNLLLENLPSKKELYKSSKILEEQFGPEAMAKKHMQLYLKVLS